MNSFWIHAGFLMFLGDSNVHPCLRTTLISHLVWSNISSNLSLHICFITVLKVVKKKTILFFFFVEWFYRMKNKSVSSFKILLNSVMGEVLNLKVWLWGGMWWWWGGRNLFLLWILTFFQRLGLQVAVLPVYGQEPS